MRKARNGEATRQAVIAAAKEAFAERGFAGTSLSSISRRCWISEGLILHHFKSKEGLYRAVLQDLAAGYVSVLAGAGVEGSGADALADRALRVAFRYWSEDTIYNRISMWAHLENRRDLEDAEARITRGLADVVGKLQAERAVDDSFEPFTLLSLAIGPILFWLSHKAQFKDHLGLQGDAKALDAAFIDQHVRLVRKAFAPTDLNGAQKGWQGTRGKQGKHGA